MIRHLVMWKLDESYTEFEKHSFIQDFSSRLLALKAKIPQIKSISVHINSKLAPETNCDLLLDSSFNSIDDLKTYSNHPEHLAVVEFSKPVKKQRSCIDYEF